MCHAWHACHLLMPPVIYLLHMLQLKTPTVQTWPPSDICKRSRLAENCVVIGTYLPHRNVGSRNKLSPKHEGTAITTQEHSLLSLSSSFSMWHLNASAQDFWWTSASEDANVNSSITSVACMLRQHTNSRVTDNPLQPPPIGQYSTTRGDH
jgi:hypothetical protein